MPVCPFQHFPTWEHVRQNYKREGDGRQPNRLTDVYVGVVGGLVSSPLSCTTAFTWTRLA